MMWRTVELTVNIMKETPSHWDVKRSYAEVAKKIGIDEETVRIRIQSLKQSGFLVGWRANLLGRESHILALELLDVQKKDRTIAQISQMDGVVLIQSFYGKILQVTIFSKNEEGLGRQMKKITSITLFFHTLPSRICLCQL